MTLFPYRTSHMFLVGLILIDLPIILAVAVIGWQHGYVNTYESIMDWRTSHPWSFIPSLALLVVLVRRWRRA